MIQVTKEAADHIKNLMQSSGIADPFVRIFISGVG